MYLSSARKPALLLAGSLLALLLSAGQCGDVTNTPPVANAGADQSVTVGDVVSLDGLASSDRDGDPLTFSWSFDSRPLGSSAVLAGADTPAPTFTADVQGEYVVVLTVSDEERTATDGVSVVAALEDQAPVLSSIEDRRTRMGEPIEVPLVIADEDPDGVTVDASSEDQSLVADQDLDVLGIGRERSLRITPSSFGTGSVRIALVVRDAGGLEDQASFELALIPPFQMDQRKLTASDAAEGDLLGGAVAISGDIAIVGAAGKDLTGTGDGAAYVFERNGDTWTEATRLTASDAADSDAFGSAVAIDGDYAVVGAPYDDDDGENSGSVYVFHNASAGWEEVAKLPPDPLVVAATATALADGDTFGESVAISDVYVLVGAPNDDDPSGSGTAYLFERCVPTFQICSQPWFDRGQLSASDATAGDQFGGSVALDGNHAVIGARLKDGAGGTDQGGAYAFERNGGAWSEIGKLTASDAGPLDEFGYSVAIDGERAVVGAIGNDDNGSASGSAYVFTLSGGTWSESSKLTASEGGALAFLGNSVAIDGDYAMMGALGADQVEDDAGAVYVFQRVGDRWIEVSTLTAQDAAVGDAFGFSVAMDGDYAVVGARTDNLTGFAEGSAYMLLR